MRCVYMRSIRELVRHALHRIGIKPSLSYVKGDRESNFRAIYEQGIWKRGDRNVPASGQGSTLDATAVLRAILPKILQEYRINSFLDVGCGDFHWMQSVDMRCIYIGLDIVPEVIERNQRKYSNADRSFVHWDMAVSTPNVSAELVLIREVLFHLSLKDGLSVIRNSIDTGCRYIMITNDTSTRFNSDIDSGDFRPLNLNIPPFNFPEPAFVIEDDGVYPGRQIGMWPTEIINVLPWFDK
jgi:SAM-dependent methyltransferase